MRNKQTIVITLLAVLFLTSCSVTRDYEKPDYYKKANESLESPKAGEQRVVFVGNSITESWIKLSPEFFSSSPYINRGISGQTSGQILKRFKHDVIQLKPSVVVILAGTNDIAENIGPIPLDGILSNIISMVELARANNITPVLASVLPVDSFFWRPEIKPSDKIIALNGMIQQYVRREGLLYIDYHSAMVNKQGGLKELFTHDGVHPNKAGYFEMETLARPTIEEAMQSTDIHNFYVGTYTNGDSEGIYKYILHTDGSLDKIGVAVKSKSPSFLAMSADKKFLLAVNEIKNEDGVGTVESFLLSGDTLKLMNRRTSGGAHPCFIAINDSGQVLTANYTGGNIGYLQLDPQGRLSELLDIQQHEGQGTTDRQQSPHAHSVWFRPNNEGIIAVDLGTNELWFSSIDPETNKFIPDDTPTLKMEDGAGPRHLAFHPNGKWIYVVNELNSSISMIETQSNGKHIIKPAVSTLPPGYDAPNTCADIRISSDGKFVYASNRGHNSIAVFEVDLKDGSMLRKGNKGCGGDGPRNFTLSPDENYLLVANQHSNNIVSLKRDKTNGLLKYVNQIEAPTPVCLVF